jgi:hypothetical protein
VKAHTPNQRRTILIGVLIALCVAVLSGNFVAYGLWQISLIPYLLAALWVLGWVRGWDAPVDLGVAGAVGLAALGAIVSTGSQTVLLSALFMLATTVCALIVWDMMRFDLRRRAFGANLSQNLAGSLRVTGIEPWRTRRTLIVLGVGFVAGVLAIVVRTQISFGWLVASVLITFGLFALGLRELRKDA